MYIYVYLCVYLCVCVCVFVFLFVCVYAELSMIYYKDSQKTLILGSLCSLRTLTSLFL